jgi:hypothetical protein
LVAPQLPFIESNLSPQSHNDISKLLEQLSGSTAWQQAVASTSLNAEQPSSSTKTSEPSQVKEQHEKIPSTSRSKLQQIASEEDVEPSNRVSELLKLLNNDAEMVAPGENDAHSKQEGKHAPKVATEETATGNLRTMSFAEALSQITKLSQNPTIIKHLSEVCIRCLSLIPTSLSSTVDSGRATSSRTKILGESTSDYQEAGK